VRHDIRLFNRLQRYTPESPQPSIVSFTIDDEEELHTLVSMVVAGIQTNHPDVLRKIVDEMGVQLA